MGPSVHITWQNIKIYGHVYIAAEIYMCSFESGVINVLWLKVCPSSKNLANLLPRDDCEAYESYPSGPRHSFVERIHFGFRLGCARAWRYVRTSEFMMVTTNDFMVINSCFSSFWAHGAVTAPVLLSEWPSYDLRDRLGVKIKSLTLLLLSALHLFPLLLFFSAFYSFK